MAKLINSKFNYVTENDGKTLVFNSLKNSLAVMDSTDYQKLLNCDYDSFSDESLELMKKNGIINTEDIDEDKKAYLKYMKEVDSGYTEFIILPTIGCNFRCPYCYEDHAAGIMSDEVIERIVKLAKSVIPSSKGFHVSWFGGEPLVALPVIEKLSERLMKIAKIYKKPYTSSMTTNGYLLTYDTFMLLFRKYHVTNYQITLDGRAQFHDKTRPLANGGPTYDVIMKNITDIKEKCKSPLYKILLRTNLTKETFDDLEAQIAELEKNFGGDNRFSLLFKAVGNWGGDTVDSIKDKIINSDELLIKKLSSIKTTLNITGRYLFVNSFNICYAAKRGTYTIDPAGKILRCTVNLYENYNILGELNDKGEIEENGSNFERWQYPAAPPAVKETQCEDCKLYANCFGIMCPARFVAGNRNSYCQSKEEELKGIYNSNKELFTVIGEQL